MSVLSYPRANDPPPPWSFFVRPLKHRRTKPFKAASNYNPEMIELRRRRQKATSSACQTAIPIEVRVKISRRTFSPYLEQ
jgi:hypothetical protein